MTAILAPPKKPESDFASESGHWYCAKTGEPRYTLTGANGKERNTTLRDARKLNLVPSVTTIAKVEAKPQLTNWLVKQGMLACLTLPRVEGEDEETFMARALEDSKQQVRQAADRGTYLHGLLEKSIPIGAIHRDVPPEDELYVLAVLNWLYKHFDGYTWSVERSFSSILGYGGKVDLHGTHPTNPPAVMDFKCKDFSDPEKKMGYPEHCSQLCAYAHGLGFTAQKSILVNIFVSSTTPGLIVTKVWDAEEKEYAWNAFLALIALWRARNKF